MREFYSGAAGGNASTLIRPPATFSRKREKELEGEKEQGQTHHFTRLSPFDTLLPPRGEKVPKADEGG